MLTCKQYFNEKYYRIIEHKGGENIRKQIISTKTFIPLLLFSFALIFCLTTVSAANTIYVNTTGNDSWTGNSSTHIEGTDIGPKATIQNGTDTVEPNGFVYVADGTYTEHIIINQNLTLIGQSLAGTIIDGTQNGRPLTINSRLNVTITNFTITNGTVTEEYALGGGIYNNRGTLTITNCNIQNNTATSTGANAYAYGGGIYNYGGTLTITNCNIQNNTANATSSSAGTYAFTCAWGGGIYNFGGILTITNCNIQNNTANATSSGTATHEHTNALGGGIYNYGGTLTITNCNIQNNTANATSSVSGADVYAFGGGIYNDGDTLTVNYSRIVGNTPQAINNVGPTVSSLEDNWWGSNNPVFGNLLFGVNPPTNWLYMTINATPTTINNTQTSLITVSFNNHSSDGSSFSPLDSNLGHIPDGVPVTFSLIKGLLGTYGMLIPPLTLKTTNGTTYILFTATSVGIQEINASTDDQKVTATVTINPSSYVDISKEFRDLPWGTVITTAYYNDKIYAIVKVHNLGPDSTSVSVLDAPNGFIWTGNYYVLHAVGSYIPTPDSWILNDPTSPFNGTHWNVSSLNTFIGSEIWLAIEVTVNQTGTVSNYAETVNQSSYPYQGYDNYTAYLIAVVAPTSLTVNSSSGYNGDTVAITSTLTDTLHNTPVINKSVTITVNGETYTANSDSNGQITWNYLIQNMDAQDYTINGTFAGNNQYDASNANGTLSVNRILTNLTVDDVTGNKDKTVLLTAILTDNQGNPLAGKTIEFWIDSVKVGESTTGTNGIATLDYKINQTPGNHNLQAIFNESTMYQGCNATGLLYVPTANLYIQITSDKNNPTVGETFTLRYKLGNKGPDDALNVTITIPIPDGFVISKIEGDGTWTIVGNNIIWTMNNVTVGDPDLHISGWTRWAGSFLFGASILSDTFNLNSRGVSSFSLNAVPQINAASVTSNTIGMQNTGTPIVPLILALLGVVGGLIATRKKQ
nr:hypothetical protein [uncultured Methanobacterium sp.]